MSCVTPTFIGEPLIDIVSPSSIVTNSCKILELDLLTMKPQDV